MSELFEEGMLDPTLVSITFGKLGHEIPDRFRRKFTEAMNALGAKGYIDEGVCITERGDTNYRKHIQGMVVMGVNNGLSMSEAST